MKLASHNSWSYATPKKWWMKLLRFTARCQDVDIKTQYEQYNVRMFDLRLRFDKDKTRKIVHGCIVYDLDISDYYDTLNYINNKKDCIVRVVLDIRTKKQNTPYQAERFYKECDWLKAIFPNIKFTSGQNLLTKEVIYDFGNTENCIERYSSVCPPNIIDDWYPRFYAKLHNHDNIITYANAEYLMIDFVNIQ